MAKNREKIMMSRCHRSVFSYLLIGIALLVMLCGSGCGSMIVKIEPHGIVLEPSKVKFQCLFGVDPFDGKWRRTSESLEGGEHFQELTFHGNGTVSMVTGPTFDTGERAEGE